MTDAPDEASSGRAGRPGRPGGPESEAAAADPESAVAPIIVPGLDAQVHMMGAAPDTNVIGGGLVFRRPPDLPLSELLERIKARVESTLDLPHGMRCVAAPVPRGEPFHVLIDKQPVDLDAHIDVRGAGGSVSMDRAYELALISMQAPLDLTRPLWGMTVIPEIDGDLAMIVMRVHHFVQDGVLGLAAAVSMLIDGTADSHLRQAPDLTVLPRPSDEQIRRAAEELLNRRYRAFKGPVEQAVEPVKPSKETIDSVASAVEGGSAARRPHALGRSLAMGLRETVEAVQKSRPDREKVLQEKLTKGLAEAREFTRVYFEEVAVQPGNLLRRVSDDRGIAVVQTPRSAVTQCQDVLDEHVSFNDVAVTAMVLALQQVLPDSTRDENLLIDIPVSLSLQTGGKEQFDNTSAMMVIETPMSQSDPGPLLRSVHEQSRDRKSRDAQAMARLMRMASILPIQEYEEATARLWSRGNFFMSNLPGPDFHFFVAGNEVTAAFGLGQLRGHSALRVIVATYGDLATWSLMYDRQVIDGRALANAIPTALERTAAVTTSDS